MATHWRALRQSAKDHRELPASAPAPAPTAWASRESRQVLQLRHVAGTGDEMRRSVESLRHSLQVSHHGLIERAFKTAAPSRHSLTVVFRSDPSCPAATWHQTFTPSLRITE